MLETEYDEQKAMELFRLEGWREGYAVGWEEGVAEGRQAVLDEIIMDTISIYREFGLDDNAIISKIMKRFDLSAELAGKYVSDTDQ